MTPDKIEGPSFWYEECMRSDKENKNLRWAIFFLAGPAFFTYLDMLKYFLGGKW